MTTTNTLHLHEPYKMDIRSLLTSRVEDLKTELSKTAQAHDKLVNEHNARCQQVKAIAEQNLARMHQLNGAILTIEDVLKSTETK